jgi:hypothetical protein
MPKLLELFAGTGSVGKAFKELGWDVVSLDIEPGHDIQADILTWDYRTAYPPGFFDAVHASPPCGEYSRAKTTGVRNLELADAILQRTLDILVYFNALVWTLENPLTAMTRHRPAMLGMDVYLRPVCYCQYGLPYKKATAIWTNLEKHWTPRPMCCKANPCENVVEGRHPQSAQRAPGKVGGVRRASKDDSFSQDQLYALPAALCDELAKATTSAVAARSMGVRGDV